MARETIRKNEVVGIGRNPRWWQPFEKAFICEHITLNQEKLGLSDEDMVAAKKRVNDSDKDDYQDVVNELYWEKSVRTTLIKYLARKNREELGCNSQKKYKTIGVVEKTKEHFDDQKKELGYSGVSHSEFVVDLIAARAVVKEVMDSKNLSFDDAIAYLSELADE